MSQVRYTVKKGDTLWDISRIYLGNGARYMEIYNENKKVMKNPHWLYPGQVLVINVASPAKPKTTQQKQTQQLINYTNRYKKTQVLDRLQENPATMKIIDFKQDYTVLVRKKQYYAITQGSDEDYIKIFQLNNFTSINTGHSIYGSGSLTVNLMGGTRVVVADKNQVSKAGWSTFQSILNGWNSVTSEISTTQNEIFQSREDKYSWAYAEKCDIEPMDEIFVFSKTQRKDKVDPTQGYQFIQIFFGYISQVSKSYTAGQQSPTITIAADDHLKLLQYSYVANRIPMDMATGGVSFRYNGVGNFIVENNYLYQGIDLQKKNPDGSYAPNPSLANYTFTNMFAGKSGSDIIKRCCIEAGIPQKYLSKRIENITRIPFMPQIQGPNSSELFAGDFQDRLQICNNAANKLNLEFFADEEGNIVFKIPTYTLGINKLDANNYGMKAPEMYSTQTITKYVSKQVVTGNTSIYHVVVKGDNLWDLASKYYKDSTKWPIIYRLNASQIEDPHWIYPGQKLLIKKGNQVTKTVKTPYTEKIETQNANTLANLTDDAITIIHPEQIISFTFTDSDKEVFTTVQVTAEVPWINNQLQSNVPAAVTQTVADFDLIKKFGYRVYPSQSTPLVSDANGAAIYGGLLLIKALSNRYTGSLTIIEEPTIKVGMPIRLHMYDENPFPEIYPLREGDDNFNAQAIFYVDSITRSISPTGVSYMTLSLRAGRMMGMPTIYDRCTELYRYFYEDVNGDLSKPVPNNKKQPVTVVSNAAKSGKKYTCVKGDSLFKIARHFYGDGAKWTKIWDANKRANGGPLSDPNRVYPGQVITIP